MVELIDRARARLDAALGATFGEEAQRFETLVPDAAELDTLVADLRAAADEVRRLTGSTLSAESVAAPGGRALPPSS